MKLLRQVILGVALSAGMLMVPALCLATTPLIPPYQCVVSQAGIKCSCLQGDSCQPAYFKACASQSGQVQAGTYYADKATYDNNPQSPAGVLEPAKFYYKTLSNTATAQTELCLTPDIPNTALPAFSGNFPVWQLDSASQAYTCSMNDYGRPQPDNCSLWNAPSKQPGADKQSAAEPTDTPLTVGVKIVNDTKNPAYNFCIKPSNQAALVFSEDQITQDIARSTLVSPYTLLDADKPILPGQNKLVMQLSVDAIDDIKAAFILVPVIPSVRSCDDPAIPMLSTTTPVMTNVYLHGQDVVQGSSAVLFFSGLPERPGPRNNNTFTIFYGNRPL